MIHSNLGMLRCGPGSTVRVSMNRPSTKHRIRVVAALVAGNPIRPTARMTSAAKIAVVKVLEDLGCTCAEYHDRHLQNCRCGRMQTDETWSVA